MRPLEDKGVTRVAVDGGGAGVAQVLDDPAVLLDDEDLHVSPLQRARDERSHATVACDDSMPLELLRAVALETSERPGAAIVEGADHPDIA